MIKIRLQLTFVKCRPKKPFTDRFSNPTSKSKLKYGQQLLGKVRWKASDPSNQDLEAIQKCQNKLARILNSAGFSDKISTKTLLANLNM